MRRKWLGDALDFWKGSFLQVLRRNEAGMGLGVVPMFTDGGWNPAELKTYASILGGTRADLVTTQQLLQSSRRAYFDEVARAADRDLFLDPDTGIATRRPKTAHVAAGEIETLLTGSNLVAVYQHRPQGVPSPWLARYVSLVSQLGAATVAYESNQAGMVFLSRSKRRVKALREALSQRLGVVANERGGLPGRLA